MLALGRWIVIKCLCLSFISVTVGQSNPLLRTIVFRSSLGIHTQKDHIQYITKNYNVNFSYNASQIDDTKIVYIESFTGSIDAFVKKVFSNMPITLSYASSEKVLITLNTKLHKPLLNKIVGVVIDSTTGESIPGALVIEKMSKKAVVSNEEGYFIIFLPTGPANLSIQYYGYKSIEKVIAITGKTNLIVNMEHSLLLPTIIVDGRSRINLHTSGDIIDVFKNHEVYSITGGKDPINSARISPGVQSGGEGQSGLYVRGGSPDQNLILLDGVAIYEANHIVGISSIFIDETINSASLIKNGFPARYGGRLSSVLDVQLKLGDSTTHKRSITVGVPGAQFHINGPLYGNKTTYNVAGKVSWLNFYVNELLTPFTKFDNIDVRYSDFVAKINHQFGKGSSLSLTMYSGADKLSLFKIDTARNDKLQLNLTDRNELKWSNQLASLKYTKIFNDRWVLKMQSGYLRYRSGARSSYTFESLAVDTTIRRELDVITSSQIDDLNVRGDLDFYVNSAHTLRAGINRTYHSVNPAIKQSTFILDEKESKINDSDSTRHTVETNLYIEDNFKLNSSLFIYAGLHAAIYKLDDGKDRFSSFQPRLNVIYSPSTRHVITAAYSRMAQFSHLISNSGLGLPTSIWVPSTDKVNPELATQYSIKYDFNITKSIYVSLGGYWKVFDNLLELTKPIELFYFLIDDQAIVPVYNNNKDWERNLIVGKGLARGIEWLIHKRLGQTQGWLSVTHAKNERQFPNLNKGRTYLANFDRPWDVNAGLTHKINSNWTVGAQFVYGSGRLFTLSYEEFSTNFLPITLVNTNDRNNYRLQPFHQLSLNASYYKTGKLFDSRIDFNVYNVYNRLNPYFVYIYRNAETNTDLGRKVSILPITPSINYTLKF